ncbi:SDR family oxidoreductase [Panacagrimonas sp.]|uniref:SDR family oxidoreductase n=1 Tax=Panacagrimonas sp. TaxID=2480088 RepID=UPI003B526560
MSNRPGKTIFITGAAQGIGKATAERFAREGWFVGLYDVNAQALDTLRAQLGADRCIAEVLDVTDAVAWAGALERFWTTAGGHLDVLLNNAGIAKSGPFQDIPLAAHHAIVDVNLKGVINGCHAGFDYLRRTQGSRLINLASASAIYGAADLASYSATKFAVRGLTEALDLEWRKLGIRVCDIWPIFVQTPMVEKLSTGSLSAMGVHLTAEDIANTVWKAATRRSRRVHWRVGAQTHLIYRAACFLPDALNRAVTASLSGH